MTDEEWEKWLDEWNGEDWEGGDFPDLGDDGGSGYGFDGPFGFSFG